MAKDKHIEIDFLGSQDEKLTKKQLAEFSAQIKLMKASRKMAIGKAQKRTKSKKLKNMLNHEISICSKIKSIY